MSLNGLDNPIAQTVARDDLVALRQSVLDIENAMKSLQLVNVAEMTAADMVELDLRARKLQAQLRDHAKRYNEALDHYAKSYLDRGDRNNV